ncbi:hypothetical protein NPIL_543011 [Nephila pilipes]|uniref:Uncharacterized protein n=1 Tax=Nephila pilipes TaxID=299642 RepID=A0A8X6QLA0_NEPPI|nr:hypothetical protein NPIL_543011 [Nephila pilipes]
MNESRYYAKLLNHHVSQCTPLHLPQSLYPSVPRKIQEIENKEEGIFQKGQNKELTPLTLSRCRHSSPEDEKQKPLSPTFSNCLEERERFYFKHINQSPRA